MFENLKYFLLDSKLSKLPYRCICWWNNEIIIFTKGYNSQVVLFIQDNFGNWTYYDTLNDDIVPDKYLPIINYDEFKAENNKKDGPILIKQIINEIDMRCPKCKGLGGVSKQDKKDDENIVLNMKTQTYDCPKCGRTGVNRKHYSIQNSLGIKFRDILDK